MKTVIGLDAGTTTTKILVMNEDGEILYTARAVASEPQASIRSAAEKLLEETGLSPEHVSCCMMTGVGASYYHGDLFGIPTSKVPEIETMGEGGLFLAGLDKAVVISFGTGTTFAKASLAEGAQHAGGIAMGGGMLTGLASRLFDTKRFEDLLELAERGDTLRVDKSINEISQDKVAGLPDFATASNLAKVCADSREEDIAAGLFNMLYQAAGTMAVFLAREFGTDSIVAVGSLAEPAMAKEMLGNVGKLYGFDFVIPENAAFATAAGAARRAFYDESA